jgi:hypothetical protein
LNFTLVTSHSLYVILDEHTCMSVLTILRSSHIEDRRSFQPSP